MDQDNFTETARALEEEDFCVQDPKNGKEPRVAHSAQAGMCPGRPCSGGGQHDLWKKASDGPLCREGVSAVDRAGSRGQLLASSFRRQPLEPTPTIPADGRDSAGVGPRTLQRHARLTLLN